VLTLDAREFQEVVKEELGPKGLLTVPGHVLYCDVGSIRHWPGGIYVLGLDPGGTPDEANTIGEDISRPEMTTAGYCALTDNRWHDRPPGTSPYQRNTLEAIGLLGYDAKRDHVPISNAIFAAFPNADELGRHPRFKDLKKACWGVHRRLIQVIRPKLILCLGAGNGLSSFSLLREWSLGTYTQIDVNSPEEVQTPSIGKFGSVKFDFLPQRTFLVGIKHPSYIRPIGHFRKELKERLERARDNLGIGNSAGLIKDSGLRN
jgi:hypothetical protein